ncbi:MAG: hypothetical protein IH984_03055 [Planctomycetes bacterium]|nr:hypothetical protein [Planctomycetota bacterium]
MYTNKPSSRQGFFKRIASVCAVCVVAAAPASALAQASKDAKVNVTDYETVDLSVQDTDLVQVLQMLSIQSEKNIIAGNDINATVTANLFDVTFYEALDAILRANGYRYHEVGNFIYIYTQAQYNEIIEAQRQREAKIFRLDNLSAADTVALITPLLSEAGVASSLGDVDAGFRPDIGNGGEDTFAFAATLVVNDYPENLEAISSLLNELDVAPQQVLVEATILQTALTEANAFGVDFTLLSNLDFLDLTNPLSAVGNLLNGDNADTGFQPSGNEVAVVDSIVGNTAGSAGLKIGVITDHISIFVKVLDEVSDTTVLARPKVMCLNRQRAEVLVGARVGYLSTTSTQTTTTQTVEFLDTGIQLVFRPFISKNGMIRLELSPSVSEASLRSVTDSNGLLVTIPDELTNEITTNVRIRDGHTLVLGGLFRESISTSRRQIPFFGDIPILGAAFRGQEDSIDRDEIIFLITPSIVKDDILWQLGEDLLAYGDALRIGAREKLLPFSNDKLTAYQNSSAQDALNRGDADLALWHINNSLRLNANQMEAVRFRLDLVGSKDKGHERSILERVFLNRMPRVERSPEASMLHIQRPLTMHHEPVNTNSWPQDLNDDSVSQAPSNSGQWENEFAPAFSQPTDMESVDQSTPKANVAVEAAAPEANSPFDVESVVTANEPIKLEEYDFPADVDSQQIDSDPMGSNAPVDIDTSNSWFEPAPTRDEFNSISEPQSNSSPLEPTAPEPFELENLDIKLEETPQESIGWIPAPAVKEEPSKFVRDSSFEEINEWVPAPDLVVEPSEFVRDASKNYVPQPIIDSIEGFDPATHFPSPEFDITNPSLPPAISIDMQPESLHPAANSPTEIGVFLSNPVDPQHEVMERYLPEFQHYHSFWWMGWDPNAADVRAWEDPFPFVTFEYLPHIVDVPVNPENK